MVVVVVVIVVIVVVVVVAVVLVWFWFWLWFGCCCLGCESVRAVQEPLQVRKQHSVGTLRPGC